MDRHLGMGFARIMAFLGNGVRRGAQTVIDKPRKLASRKRGQPREVALEAVQAEQAPAVSQPSQTLLRYTQRSVWLTLTAHSLSGAVWEL